MRHVDTIIVHTTATPPGRRVTVEDVDDWHFERGWNGIGYHWLIGLEKDEIWPGRPEEKIGAHVYGHNTGSIGICYVGGNNTHPYFDTRTDAQKESLITIIKDIMGRYPINRIAGHNYFDPFKACPCFNAKSEYAYLLEGKEQNNMLLETDAILKVGSFGQAVYEWQRKLKEFGYTWIVVDGKYGPETAKLTKAFQTARSIVMDGTVGPQSRETMEDVLEAIRMTEENISWNIRPNEGEDDE